MNMSRHIAYLALAAAAAVAVILSACGPSVPVLPDVAGIRQTQALRTYTMSAPTLVGLCGSPGPQAPWCGIFH
jgi:hypothetical protein